MRLRLALLALIVSTPAYAQSVSSGAMSMVNVDDPPATSTTSTSNATSHVITPPTVVAPGLAAAGIETCLGSASGGLSLMGGGFTFGSTKVDEGCTIRLLARQLFAFGFRKAALALMCEDQHVVLAMSETGTPCPPSPVQLAQSDPISRHSRRPPKLRRADRSRSCSRSPSPASSWTQCRLPRKRRISRSRKRTRPCSSANRKWNDAAASGPRLPGEALRTAKMCPSQRGRRIMKTLHCILAVSLLATAAALIEPASAQQAYGTGGGYSNIWSAAQGTSDSYGAANAYDYSSSGATALAGGHGVNGAGGFSGGGLTGSFTTSFAGTSSSGSGYAQAQTSGYAGGNVSGYGARTH